ncbi:hypothetical protein J6590_074297 [Homalodisca vitripennis]|nr:hypothetical protein J6590_074297 [Homalodisca vitripennis]
MTVIEGGESNQFISLNLEDIYAVLNDVGKAIGVELKKGSRRSSRADLQQEEDVLNCREIYFLRRKGCVDQWVQEKYLSTREQTTAVENQGSCQREELQVHVKQRWEDLRTEK